MATGDFKAGDLVLVSGEAEECRGLATIVRRYSVSGLDCHWYVCRQCGSHREFAAPVVWLAIHKP